MPPRFRYTLAPAALALLLAAPALAHTFGVSQLRLRIDEARVHGEWEMHIRDARLAAGLPTDLPDEAAWRDLAAHEGRLRDSLAKALVLVADGETLRVGFTATPLAWHAARGNVQLELEAQASREPDTLAITYRLLDGLDALHRGFFSVQDARATNLGVFKNEIRSATLPVRHLRRGPLMLEFAREGIGHIWTGLDHVLFLLALLLPAALSRAGADWEPRSGLAATAREVVKVVTAFTVSHSVTLALSFFGVLQLPSRWVESAIALSVFAAAWNNLRPFLPGRAWSLALGFGLIHGLGFAGALGQLGVPRQARGLALGSFNVGVELGQLAIVAVGLPLIYLTSRRRWYPRRVMGVGSLAIAWMSVMWFLERALGVTLVNAPWGR